MDVPSKRQWEGFPTLVGAKLPQKVSFADKPIEKPYRVPYLVYVRSIMFPPHAMGPPHEPRHAAFARDSPTCQNSSAYLEA